MTIEELIKELEQYDKELDIHVYSITNDKDATISHIGRGDDENGTMETFVSICTEDSGAERTEPKAHGNEPIISIKPNAYNPVTEIRPEVVQMICDAFLCGSKFIPYEGNRVSPTRYVFSQNGKAEFIPYNCSDTIRIYDCEMAKAFEVLQDADYNMFSIKDVSGFVEIVCSEKPYYQKKGIFYGRINNYTEHID